MYILPFTCKQVFSTDLIKKTYYILYIQYTDIKYDQVVILPSLDIFLRFKIIFKDIRNK